MLVVMTLAACGSTPVSRPHPARAVVTEPPFGSLPTYLPSDDADTDGVLVATSAAPALATQGEPVLVHLPQGTVRAVVAGPQVPAEGLPYDSPTSTCTWTVTLTGADTTIGIDPAAFTTLDHFGAVYRPKLVAGQGKAPSSIAPGQSVTFQLRTRMKVGEGLIRWAPGGRTLASWDFVVETD